MLKFCIVIHVTSQGVSTEHLYDINEYTTADSQFSLLSYRICYTEKPIQSHMAIKSQPMLQSKNTMYNESLEPKGGENMGGVEEECPYQ